MNAVEYVFGYGSLVNHATHDHGPYHLAQLRGWQRVWRFLPTRAVAVLSVEPHKDAQITGLVARVAAAKWPELDARESMYLRHDLTVHVDHAGPSGTVQTYVVPPQPEAPAQPILLSYLDVIVQGYDHWLGEQGVAAFFDTTTGWQGGVLDDRSQPLYPRHQPLTAAQRRLTDTYLAQIL